MPRFAVIVPGAGKGERFGGNESKTLARLDGRPIFIRALEPFISREDVCQTLFVVNPSEIDHVRSKYAANLSFMGVQLVEGGDTRAESIARALPALHEEADHVAIHDAVRPCVTAKMIEDVFAEALKTGAAILASPIVGTVKRAGESGVIERTVPRTHLFEAQTPQVFRRDVIELAYKKRPTDSAVEISDDAQLVESTGHPVSIVISDPTNLKITTKADLALANAILKARPQERTSKPMGAFEEAQW